MADFDFERLLQLHGEQMQHRLRYIDSLLSVGGAVLDMAVQGSASPYRGVRLTSHPRVLTTKSTSTHRVILGQHLDYRKREYTLVPRTH